VERQVKNRSGAAKGRVTAWCAVGYHYLSKRRFFEPIERQPGRYIKLTIKKGGDIIHLRTGRSLMA
jgi:hypothetical protein